MAAGDINIIGDVTTTLQRLLTDQWPPGQSVDVTLDSPAGLTSSDQNPTGLNLFLYQVLENPHAKNQPWPTLPTGELEYPPLALDLFYLVTPYAQQPLSAHFVLSQAMRIFYENAILTGAQLSEALELSVEQLGIVLCPMTLEELTRIWNALQSPYRLSVCYQTRIVLVQTEIRRQPFRVETKINVFERT